MVIGGIYLGIFTPAEAAGVGAVGAFLIAAIRRKLGSGLLLAALRETLTTTTMIFFVLISAVTLNNLIVFSGIASGLSGLVSGLALSPMITMAVILVIYLVLGCFLYALAMILLTVPIFFPIVSSLGLDPVWFGIVVVMVVELGLITPPLGMNIFVIKGMTPEVPLAAIYRGVMPFVLAQIVLISIVFLVPVLVLWLPETARALR